jgi:hypothetical protein
MGLGHSPHGNFNGLKPGISSTGHFIPHPHTEVFNQWTWPCPAFYRRSMMWYQND